MKKLFKQFSFPRRHLQPRRADDARLHSRRRRARLFAQPCLRRRVRQPRPHRRLRRRRRRSRDRPAGDGLAVDEVSSIPPATGPCCRSCTSTATRSAIRRVLARIEPEELEQFFRGCGWTPYFVEGDDPAPRCIELMAATLDAAIEDIRRIAGHAARRHGDPARPRWPMIVLRSPKGWTGPEGRRRPAGRGHVPRAPGAAAGRPPNIPSTSSSSRSLDEELQGRGAIRQRTGRLRAELAELAPQGDPADGRQPAHQRRRALLRDLRMPDFHEHAVNVPSPGAVDGQDTHGARQVPARRRQLNQEQRNFRVFGPDETLSNLLGAVFEVTEPAMGRREARTMNSCARRAG